MSDQDRDPRAVEAWEHRDDTDEWTDEAEQIDVRSPVTHVVSFRIPAEEIEQLTECARLSAESVSEYVRKAIAIRMHGTPIGPSIGVATGGRTLVVQSHIVTPRSTDGDLYEWIPDQAPETSSIT
jgi:hypothetical protein